MTGELWWRRLVNSARFLDDLKDTLADDKSVLLLFDTDIPWLDIMTETLEQSSQMLMTTGHLMYLMFQRQMIPGLIL